MYLSTFLEGYILCQKIKSTKLLTLGALQTCVSVYACELQLIDGLGYVLLTANSYSHASSLSLLDSMRES